MIREPMAMATARVLLQHAGDVEAQVAAAMRVRAEYLAPERPLCEERDEPCPWCG
jgi:hypothetical protein